MVEGNKRRRDQKERVGAGLGVGGGGEGVQRGGEAERTMLSQWSSDKQPLSKTNFHLPQQGNG